MKKGLLENTDIKYGELLSAECLRAVALTRGNRRTPTYKIKRHPKRSIENSRCESKSGRMRVSNISVLF